MKKKFLSWLIIATMTLSLVACNDSEKTTEEPVEETTQTEENIIGENIEVDENLLTMEITMPAEYMEDTTQEDLDEVMEKYEFISATLNDDGSATYVMTKGKHKEFMNDIANEYNTMLQEMVASEDYPNITSIKTNDDFTSFTVTTKSTDLDFSESFSIFAFYIYGGMYNQFNGTPVDNIHVEFINAASGEVISSSDSKDLAEDTETK